MARLKASGRSLSCGHDETEIHNLVLDVVCVRLRAAYIQRSSYEPLQPTIFLHLLFFQTETTTRQKLWTSRGLGAVSG